MVKAYVLINADVGQESDIAEELKRIPEVKTVDMVYGVYDMIIIVEKETMQDLKDFISVKIRRLEKIRSTLTMIVVS